VGQACAHTEHIVQQLPHVTTMEMVLGDDIHKFRQLAGVVAARGLLPLLQGDFQSRGRSQHCTSLGVKVLIVQLLLAAIAAHQPPIVQLKLGQCKLLLHLFCLQLHCLVRHVECSMALLQL